MSKGLKRSLFLHAGRSSLPERVTPSLHGVGKVFATEYELHAQGRRDFRLPSRRASDWTKSGFCCLVTPNTLVVVVVPVLIHGVAEGDTSAHGKTEGRIGRFLERVHTLLTGVPRRNKKPVCWNMFRSH